MDKPKVFANPINKKIINSQEVFYEKKPDVRQDNYDSYNVLKKINDIFNSSHHIYKSKVSILTKDGEIVGDLGHLSAYALVGTEKEETSGEATNETNNPKTSDNIVKDIIMLALSLSGLTLGIVLLKKNRK